MNAPESQQAGSRSKPREVLGTIWGAPDALWHLFEPLLTGFDPPSRTGRPRADQRRCLDGMIYRARTG